MAGYMLSGHSFFAEHLQHCVAFYVFALNYMLKFSYVFFTIRFKYDLCHVNPHTCIYFFNKRCQLSIRIEPTTPTIHNQNHARAHNGRTTIGNEEQPKNANI